MRLFLPIKNRQTDDSHAPLVISKFILLSSSKVPPSRGQLAKRGNACNPLCARNAAVLSMRTERGRSKLDGSNEGSEGKRRASWKSCACACVGSGERGGKRRRRKHRERAREIGAPAPGLWNGSVGWELGEQPVSRGTERDAYVASLESDRPLASAQVLVAGASGVDSLKRRAAVRKRSGGGGGGRTRGSCQVGKRRRLVAPVVAIG